MKFRERSFTLIEILVYIAALAIIIFAVLSFIMWFIHSNTKAKVMRETLNSANKAMEVMTHYIRESRNTYTPSSVFNSHPGQLSLETTRDLPTGERVTYIDFYLCDNRLCIKKESQDSVALTSDNVELTNLVFTRIVSGQSTSVKIDLTATYKNPANKPEYQAIVDLTSTATLRIY